MRTETDSAVDSTLDEAISPERKVFIYKTLKEFVAFKMFGNEINADWADELVSQQYEKLMRKPVAKAFPKGVPESDAQWTAYLIRDSKWSVLNHLKKQWRHRTDSLDEEVSDDEGGTTTLADRIADEGESGFRPWVRKPDFFKTNDARHELSLVRKAFKLLCRGMSAETRDVLKDLVLRGMSNEEVAAKYGLRPGAVYAKRFRFNEAVKDYGRSVLEMVEREAA